MGTEERREDPQTQQLFMSPLTCDSYMTVRLPLIDHIQNFLWAGHKAFGTTLQEANSWAVKFDLHSDQAAHIPPKGPLGKSSTDPSLFTNTLDAPISTRTHRALTLTNGTRFLSSCTDRFVLVTEIKIKHGERDQDSQP